jgi:hypothetical protein
MGKIRVYELARELNVDSKQVLAALAANGEFIRSASAALEPDVAQAVRERLWRKPAATELRAERGRRPELAPGRAGWAAAVPRQARGGQPTRTVAVSDLAPLERLVAKDLAEGPRIPEHRLELIKTMARAWAAQWFTDKDAAPWLALRVRPADARQCRELGITPEMMQLPFRMPGRALCGGTLTYLTAFLRGDVTIPEIRDELARTGHLPQTPQTGEVATQS